MTSGMTAFAIAVGGTSLACYVLTTRLQNRRGPRRSSSDNSGADGGHVSDGGGMPFGWSGGDHSVSDSSDDLAAAQTQAIAEVAAKAVAEVMAEAINPVRPWKTNGILIRCSKGF